MSDAPDEYERQYMDGDLALARVRERRARWFPAFFLTAVSLAVASILPTLWKLWQYPEARAMALFFSVVIGLEFLALFPALVIGHITRAVVTPTHLHVHAGLLRAEVPVAAITGLAVEPVRGWRTPGTARGRLLGREQVLLHLGARHFLRVEWQDARGRAQTLWAQLDAAPALCALLASLTPARPGVRIAPDTEAVEALDDDAEPALAARRGRR